MFMHVDTTGDRNRVEPHKLIRGCWYIGSRYLPTYFYLGRFVGAGSGGKSQFGS